MLAPDDPFLSLFKETFDFNYDASITHRPRRNPDEVRALVPDSPPLNFHDRHIGSNLVLKQLVYIPSLAHGLSKLCDKMIEEFLGNGYKFHGEDFDLDYDDGVIFQDSEAVSNYYKFNVGRNCHQFASKILLHPHCGSWSSLFAMIHKTHTPFLTEAWLESRGTTDMGDLWFGNTECEEKLKLSINQSTHDKLLDIRRKHPRLAIWNFFAMTDIAIGLLRNHVNSEAGFIWDNCRTLGFETKSYSTLPLDAAKLVAQLVPELKAKRTRIDKSSAASNGSPKTLAKVAKFIEPSKTSKRQRRYRLEFRHLLQHAWAKAVENDATFIILNCGRYERIGIRHRASQTLYLSGLIDTVNIQDPRYRKLHVALNMAIVQDVLQRHDLSTMAGTKRPAEEADVEESLPPAKRRKTMISLPKDEPKHSEIMREIGPRMIALVNLKYGPFCSPTPASFIRIGPSCAPIFQPELLPMQKLKRKYLAHEYFTLVLDEPRGEGSTGIVHPAALEAQVKLPSGEVSTMKSSNLVLKLAFSNQQQKRLRHEFDVYSHLARKQVKGVIPVHGLFRESDSGVLGLLMDNGGQNLRQREMERTGEEVPAQVTLSEAERAAFTAIFKGIHKARVRHQDVRADNLLVNPTTGEVFVIDFDRADIAGAFYPNYDIEMQCLQNIFDKKYELMNYDYYR
ncbi:hypothetical protein M413DRAFT_125221 [Hebeloma cylindrosporum]|uniref:Protein kinase domain-containing protein n=1 Tax=Hebeloma cylindrosporum TaxID=76867 RepID=A0A0C3C1T7_HEBCY|nr:hypothetical protein M413DRAFT_125221 [Hebeloma cylindrosporum h7]